MEDAKTCSRCVRRLPLEAFNRKGKGHRAWCKQCTQELDREAYRARREQYVPERAHKHSLKDFIEANAADESTTEVASRRVPASSIQSLDDLVAHLKLDLDRVKVPRFWVKSMKDGESFNVSAQIEPLSPLTNEKVIEQIWADFKTDAQRASPRLTGMPVDEYRKRSMEAQEHGPKMVELALMDPHLGMLAWGKEVGVPYDLQIAENDYMNAFDNLLATSTMYMGVDTIVMLVGNDLFHVDGPGFDAKGGARGGATTAGTMQDFDTRIARLFTHIRRLLVRCIDKARAVAPTVIVQMVPGNHDRHTIYKMGEVLHAWYRNDGTVIVRNSPSVRDYLLYGHNLFMFTHGQEFRRKRDNLVSVFATECPPEMWVEGRVREVHVGHNHISMEKVYTGDPHETVWEGRAVRVRSLPGLTTEDSWHFENGYKHGRRATALVWRKEGGLLGLHEYTL